MTRFSIDGNTETVDGSQPTAVPTYLRDSTLARLKDKTAEKERYENAAIVAASDVEMLQETLDRYSAALGALEALDAPAPEPASEEPAAGDEEPDAGLEEQAA